MQVMVMGLNYRTAPVEVRECFSFPESVLEEALSDVLSSDYIYETVVVSTCNRTEIYALVDSVMEGTRHLQRVLARWSHVQSEVFLPHIYIYSAEAAIQHLFRVTTGLDSMVLGETQILGQVRDAFLFAQERKATASTFNHLFKQAITVAKRAHTETDISKHAVSISYAAVELAKKVFDDVAGKTVLIIGAGKMSELTGKHLYHSGFQKVMVVNRTYERAKELADLFGGRALDMQSLDLALREADIVISSTGASNYVVDKEIVARVMKQRKNRPMFMVDIAVPRDLDPEIHALKNVYLYDIDDLQGVVNLNLTERSKEADKIEVLLTEEQVAFSQWLMVQEATPLISELRKKATQLQSQTVQNLSNKIPNLTERDIHLLQKYTMSMMNQLLHEPIAQIKDMAAEPDAEIHLETFKRLFGLQDSHDSKEAVATTREVQRVRQEQSSALHSLANGMIR